MPQSYTPHLESCLTGSLRNLERDEQKAETVTIPEAMLMVHK